MKKQEQNLELKNAELEKQLAAKNRELEIEAALERVRARAMAMQNSNELADFVTNLFNELSKLHFTLARCLIWIIDADTLNATTWMANPGVEPASYQMQYFDHPYYKGIIKAWKARNPKWAYELKGEEKQALDDIVFDLPALKDTPEVVKAAMRAIDKAVLSFSFSNFGGLQVDGTESLSDDNLDILARFSKVFDQTYTRFSDLKKAEAQAREGEIQLALERVRARTMAMQKSDELAETVSLLFKQLLGLGIRTEQIRTCGIVTFKDNEPLGEQWITETNGEIIPQSFMVPYDEAPAYKAIYMGWKHGVQFMVIHLEGEKLKEHLGYLSKGTNVPTRDVVLPQQAAEIFNHVMFFSQGCLFIITKEALPAYHDVFKRFGAVFQQSYTRFLDLQRAEAQAREAQIEAALEKVRSRSLAMHKSDELRDVVKVVFERLQALDFAIDGAAFIVTPGETSKEVNIWIGDNHTEYPTCFRTPFYNYPVITDIFEAVDSGSDFFSRTYSIDEKNPWFEFAFQHTDYKYLPGELKSWILSQENLTQCFALAKNSGVGIHFHNRRPLSGNEIDILKRFSKVFEQSYIRFLDLQKAEAQAREAQIENALEKVRSRSLAMHKTEELQDVVSVVFEKLQELEFVMDAGAIIFTFTEGSKDVVQWIADPGKSVASRFVTPFIDHPIPADLWRAKESGKDFFAKIYSFEEKNIFFKAAFELSEYKFLPDDAKKAILDCESYSNSVALAKNSAILIPNYNGKLFPERENDILKRFARVFEQSYIRFLDLQKAEAQAREAQIEASLERVRGKAMAMRNSGDLSAAASTVFTELRNLGINPIRSGVGLLSKDNQKAKLYSNTSSATATHLSLMGEIDTSCHPLFEPQYQAWLKQQNYFVALGGKELAAYYKILSGALNADLNISVKKSQKEYGHWFVFSEGFLYAWSDKEYTDAEIKILERFKNVIELTFRRYVELQKSEAAAREAIRQASLDRVRAEIASMRSISDLDRITPLIWNELTTLGVPFIRCGVFIMDETLQVIHTYLSTPDGKAIAAFQLRYNDNSGNRVNQTALTGWRNKQVVTLHWTEEEFKEFSHTLVRQGEVASEDVYLTERPPTGLDLHFFPFLQGMLYAGNTEPLNEDDKDLVQSLANAFSTAYARYEDFNRLELAKQEVERTLTDLRTAQTRLIQSEKMASLGELTAGIAHEIQNPLNFVNNFSEVNQDLLEELKAESLKPKAARDEQLETELINDLINNEQKISHHGKRADGIVKGMLQHSRTAGGEKLPININSIAEEYMRLSYHGLRAKDKAFNAEMVMNFDPDLPKIMAVGQDIGRVLLNLFNNAFYAVNQKKKAFGAGYNPEVSVTTSTADGQVIINVKDNGIGIPDSIKEKIMQPFFTTKPTGEGTGLGLSLTYDMVVKGHGGSIEVNTKEGGFTQFNISLPIK